jgi:hypothetical protein
MIDVSTPATHRTAQAQLVEAAGVEFAYRRFGPGFVAQEIALVRS